MGLRAIILGCGSSGGVPRVGGDWGACDPCNPKNRRRRCSLLVEYWEGEAHVPHEKRTVVLIDTSPDLREQLLDAQTTHIEAVLFTHEHGDQTNGMDDIRAIAYRKREQIPTYMSAEAYADLKQRFAYIFEKPDGRIHPPILKVQPVIKAGDSLQIDGPGGALDIGVLDVPHGNVNALGFTFCGRAAYCPDAHDLSAATLASLERYDVWILDTLRYHDHPTHAHADKALRWAAQTRVKTLVTTNMHIDMDYETLRAALPGPQIIGYDGLVIERQYA